MDNCKSPIADDNGDNKIYSENVRTVYYDDERCDDFSGKTRDTIKIGDDFKFIHKNIFWRAAAFIVYRIIMTPFAYLYCKFRYRLKIVNRRVMKRCRGGCFLYANHTLLAGDAFVPNLVTFPKKNYIVVHPDNISVKGTKNFLMMCGAIPLPQSTNPLRAMMNAVEKRILQGKCVTVYPEAHIWPFYTGIRNFSSTSLMFPVKYDVPVFVSTTTFSERKKGKLPKVTVYVDGPFYPDATLKPRAASEKLASEVTETLRERAKNSTYEYIHYEKREKGKDGGEDDKSDVRG